MGTELSPLESVQEQIKNKIKAEFVSLMPEELWQNMVKQVVQGFIADKVDEYNRNRVIASPLKQMIEAEIQAIVKDRLKRELEVLTMQSWDGAGGATISNALKELVEKNFNDILGSVQKGLVSFIVHEAVNHMRNSLR